MADVDLDGRMVLSGDETTRSGAGSGVSYYVPHKEFQNRWMNIEASKLEGKMRTEGVPFSGDVKVDYFSLIVLHGWLVR